MSVPVYTMTMIRKAQMLMSFVAYLWLRRLIEYLNAIDKQDPNFTVNIILPPECEWINVDQIMNTIYVSVELRIQSEEKKKNKSTQFVVALYI